MYSTDTEYTTYASSIGVTLPDLEADRDIQRLKAKEYIDSQEQYLKGIRAERDQDDAYPRSGLVINSYAYDNDEIPDIVVKVEIELALEINAGIDLYERNDDLPVIKERVEGAIEVQYATPTTVQTRTRYSKAMVLMKQLMKSNGISIPIERA